MMPCKKCFKVCGVLLLILGLLFLLQDLGVWDFWGINWYTALFILIGVGKIAMSKCSECMKGK